MEKIYYSLTDILTRMQIKNDLNQSKEYTQYTSKLSMREDGILATATSYHCESIRSLRRDIYKHVAPCGFKIYPGPVYYHPNIEVVLPPITNSNVMYRCISNLGDDRVSVYMDTSTKKLAPGDTVLCDKKYKCSIRERYGIFAINYVIKNKKYDIDSIVNNFRIFPSVVYGENFSFDPHFLYNQEVEDGVNSIDVEKVSADFVQCYDIKSTKYLLPKLLMDAYPCFLRGYSKQDINVLTDLALE